MEAIESMAKSFIVYSSTISLSLSYCYFFSSKFPKGIKRFISLIPIFYLFTTLPLRCSSTFTTAVTFAFITWLANFKLVRFAFDLDQSPYQLSDSSLLKFIIFTSFPIKTTENSVKRRSNRFQFQFQFKLGFQIVIYSVLVTTVLSFGTRFHPKVVSFIYGWLLFLMIDIVTAACDAVLVLVTGLELEPSSDEPYRATSLQNFWGRWNLLVTNSLRNTVYKPVVVALRRRKWAPLAGVLASFLVSGLMHELFVYQLSRAAPTWEMTSFFMIHGVSVVVEMIVKREVAGGSWRLPEFVGWLLTMAFVVVTGVSLFVPPFIRERVDVRMLQEYTSLVNFIKSVYLLIFHV
ncbi:hypothetical protein SSX86_000439 [Deinandra increscens subsp. villosa]|uniref:Wax synthase domain-containing protein n=1 Tax=Deinandra increscens subsp. villosa TaxID=3103831 RepID=A0AAP0DT58_9ASTR